MDLINRTELLRHLDDCLAEGDAQTPIVNAVLIAIKCAVEQMQRVDAVPVRHGQWLDVNDENAKRRSSDGRVIDAYCSECGRWLVGSDEYACDDNYCPYCGAKMDGDEE